MASTTMTVKLADLAQVQRLVVAAAGVIASVGVIELQWVRTYPGRATVVNNAALVDLLDALEALTPEEKEKAS